VFEGGSVQIFSNDNEDCSLIECPTENELREV
jgi:hypothetical protein